MGEHLIDQDTSIQATEVIQRREEPHNKPDDKEIERELNAYLKQ